MYKQPPQTSYNVGGDRFDKFKSTAKNIMTEKMSQLGVFLLIVYALTAMLMFGNASTMIFLTDDLYISVDYWFQVLNAIVIFNLVLTFTALVFHSTYQFVSKLSLFFSVAWIVAHFVFWVFLLVELLDCENSFRCSPAFDCEGAPFGVYDGARTTFIMTFIAHSVAVVLEAAIVYYNYLLTVLTPVPYVRA